jgi:hypothetical protein
MHISKLMFVNKQTVTRLKFTNKVMRVYFVLHLQANLKIVTIRMRISNVSVKLQIGLVCDVTKVSREGNSPTQFSTSPLLPPPYLRAYIATGSIMAVEGPEDQNPLKSRQACWIY